jgi:hypothetical protein
MRCILSLSLAGAFALITTTTAIAATPAAAAVAPDTVVIAERLQKALATNYGSEEGVVLQRTVADSLARAMQHAGLTARADLRLEVLLSDARPSHPTRHQLSANPALDFVRSKSLGGATLSAVLRDANGKELERVSFDRYATMLSEVSPALEAWADARLAIDRFADEVVKAYRRHPSV